MICWMTDLNGHEWVTDYPIISKTVIFFEIMTKYERYDELAIDVGDGLMAFFAFFKEVE